MGKIGKIFVNINYKKLVRYLIPTFLLIILLILIGNSKFTQARYESEVSVSGSPNLAFFIVDVTTQNGHIKLDDMVPRTTPYIYTFSVSNFNNQKRANVDLKYTIEIITTTNMPLEFQLFKGNEMRDMPYGNDTVNMDENGVYYRHLIIDGESEMKYDRNYTDNYTLWVTFPETNKNYPEKYEGIIDLIDIKIDAEQVV